MPLFLLHPAVVHFPIVLLLLASGGGLAYIHWRQDATLRTMVWWAMIGGWVSLIGAIITGLIAQGGLPPDAPYRQVLNLHTTTGLLLALIYGDLLYRGWLHNSGQGKKRRKRRASEEEEAAPLPFLMQPNRKWLLTAELILGAVVVVLSGHWGGELVYIWGVNVQR